MNHEEKPTSRRRLALTTIVATVAAAVIALPAFALQIGTAPPAVFELDGNAFTDHGGGSLAGQPDDWDRVCYQVEFQRQKSLGASDPAAAAAATALCTATQSTTGATAVAWAQQGPSTGFTFTGGGSKDPLPIEGWAWNQASGGLPGKDILLNGFAARYNSPGDSTTCPGSSNGSGLPNPPPGINNQPPATPCNEVFFGMDRFDNAGDAQNGFWFLQNQVSTTGGSKSGGGMSFTCSATPCHKNGDVLVVSDFSIGGTISTITVYRWNTTCTAAGKPASFCADTNLELLQSLAAAQCPGATNAPFCGIVNLTNSPSPWPFADKAGTLPANTFAQGEFYEGGIDLSSFPGLAAECFASSLAESRSSTSTSAVLKSFVLQTFGKCTSGTVTKPQSSSDGGTTWSDITAPLTIPTAASGGSITVRDKAVVTVGGAASFDGSVTFSLCGPLGLLSTTNCLTGGVSIGSSKSVVPPSPATVFSDGATLTSVGRYCWRANYSGDSSVGVPPSSDPNQDAVPPDTSTTECFVVNPVTPTLTTTAGTSPVLLGNPVTDTASLSGTANQPGTNGIGPGGTINATNGAAAGGTITFSLFGPSTSGCGSQVDSSQTAGVTGDATYGPVSITPTAAGTYHWVASYTPDTSGNTLGTSDNLACSATRENVTVVTLGISTAQSFIPNDSATIASSDGVTNVPAGNVTFSAYVPSTGATALQNCTANGATGLLFTQPVSVGGGTPSQTASTTNTIAVPPGTVVYWNVSYAPTSGPTKGRNSVCVENTTLTITDDPGPGTTP